MEEATDPSFEVKGVSTNTHEKKIEDGLSSSYSERYLHLRTEDLLPDEIFDSVTHSEECLSANDLSKTQNDEGESNVEEINEILRRAQAGKLPNRLESSELMKLRLKRASIWSDALKKEDEAMIAKDYEAESKERSTFARRNSMPSVDPAKVDEIFERADLPRMNLTTAMAATGIVSKAKKKIYQEQRSRQAHGIADIIPFDARQALEIVFNQPDWKDQAVLSDGREQVRLNSPNARRWFHSSDVKRKQDLKQSNNKTKSKPFRRKPQGIRKQIEESKNHDKPEPQGIRTKIEHSKNHDKPDLDGMNNTKVSQQNVSMTTSAEPESSDERESKNPLVNTSVEQAQTKSLSGTEADDKIYQHISKSNDSSENKECDSDASPLQEGFISHLDSDEMKALKDDCQEATLNSEGIGLGAAGLSSIMEGKEEDSNEDEEEFGEFSMTHLSNTIPSLPQRGLRVTNKRHRKSVNEDFQRKEKEELKKLLRTLGKQGKLSDRIISSLLTQSGANTTLVEGVTVTILEEFIEELQAEISMVENFASARESCSVTQLTQWGCQVMGLEHATVLWNVEPVSSESSITQRDKSKFIRDEELLAQFCKFRKSIVVADNIQDHNTIWNRILNQPTDTRNAICIPLFNKKGTVSGVMVFRNHLRDLSKSYTEHEIVTKKRSSMSDHIPRKKSSKSEPTDLETASISTHAKIGICGSTPVLFFETPVPLSLQTKRRLRRSSKGGLVHEEDLAGKSKKSSRLPTYSLGPRSKDVDQVIENLKTNYSKWSDSDIILAKCIANLALAIPSTDNSSKRRFCDQSCATECDAVQFEEMLNQERVSFFKQNCYRGDDLFELVRSAQELLKQILKANRATILIPEKLNEGEDTIRQTFWVTRTSVDIAGMDQFESLLERKENVVSALERNAIDKANTSSTPGINQTYGQDEIMNIAAIKIPFKQWVKLQVPGQNSGIRALKNHGNMSDRTNSCGSWAFKKDSFCATAARQHDSIFIKFTDTPKSSFETEGARVPRSWNTTSEIFIPLLGKDVSGKKQNTIEDPSLEEKDIFLGLIRLERDIALRRVNKELIAEPSTPCFDDQDYNIAKRLGKQVSQHIETTLKSVNETQKILKESRMLEKHIEQVKRSCLLNLRIARACQSLDSCMDIKSLVTVANQHIGKLFEGSLEDPTYDNMPDLDKVFRYDQEYKKYLGSNTTTTKPHSAWYEDKELSEPEPLSWNTGKSNLSKIPGCTVTSSVICDIAIPKAKPDKGKKSKPGWDDLFQVYTANVQTETENEKQKSKAKTEAEGTSRRSRRGRKDSRGDARQSEIGLNFSHIVPSPVTGGGLVQEVYTEETFRFPDFEINARKTEVADHSEKRTSKRGSSKSLSSSSKRRSRSNRRRSKPRKRSSKRALSSGDKGKDKDQQAEEYEYEIEEENNFTTVKSALAHRAYKSMLPVAAYSTKYSRQATIVAPVKTSEQEGKRKESNSEEQNPENDQLVPIPIGADITDIFSEERQETVVFGIPLKVESSGLQENAKKPNLLGVLRVRFHLEQPDKVKSDPRVSRRNSTKTISESIERAFNELSLSGTFEAEWLDRFGRHIAKSLARIKQLEVNRNNVIEAKLWREDVLSNFDVLCTDGMYRHLECIGKRDRSKLINRNAKTTAEIMSIAEASQIPLGVLVSGDLRKLTGNKAMPEATLQENTATISRKDGEGATGKPSRNRRRSRKISNLQLQSGKGDTLNPRGLGLGSGRHSTSSGRERQVKTRAILDEEKYGQNVVPIAGILMEQVAALVETSNFTIYLASQPICSIDSSENFEVEYFKMYDSLDPSAQWGFEIQQDRHQIFGSLSLFSTKRPSRDRNNSKSASIISKLINNKVMEEKQQAAEEDYRKIIGHRSVISKEAVQHAEDIGHGKKINLTALPLTLQDGNITFGFVSFANCVASKTDLEVMQAYANLAALDIQNWINFKQNARELLETNLLYETSRIISFESSNSNLSKALHRIGNAACNAASCEYCVAFLPDENGVNEGVDKNYYVGYGLVESENIFTTDKERLRIDINSDFSSVITQTIIRYQGHRVSIWDEEYNKDQADDGPPPKLNPYIDDMFHINTKSICAIPLVSTKNAILGAIIFINKFKEVPAFLHNPKMNDLLPKIPELQKAYVSGLNAEATESDSASSSDSVEGDSEMGKKVTKFSQADYKKLERFSSIASLSVQWHQESKKN